MATSNKVFVSPGVYTSEKDLSFVSQSVGVSTLGLSGETLKGPAFEPILIKNFDEFKQYFGNTSPLKDGNNNPKYELAYNAKSYLQESNQLFVTRVLGLTGYKAGFSYGIKTIGGNVITNTTPEEVERFNFNGTTVEPELMSYIDNKLAYNGESMEDYLINTYGPGNTPELGEFPNGNLAPSQSPKWFTIGHVPNNMLTGLQASKRMVSPITGLNEVNSINNKNWFNSYYLTDLEGDVTSVYSLLFVWVNETVGFEVTIITYEATINTNFNNVIVASLRSRGKYINEVLHHEVTGVNGVTLAPTVGSSSILDFDLVVNGNSNMKTFSCSLDKSSTKFITKVIGNSVFDKSYEDFGVYVDEIYSAFLKSGLEKGQIRGISLDIVSQDEDCNFTQPWDTTISPMVVSEVRGGQVADLFELQTISDGETANFEIKISIMNINIDNGEFDLLVRDFNDTDDNMVVLEKFTRCSMNPNVAGFIGRKIGTSDGEYQLRSKFVSLILADNHPTDAIPSGFRGFANNTQYGTSTLGAINYKTEYHLSGDVVGYDLNGNEKISGGDKINKVSLGLSSQVGFDKDLLKYKGLEGITKTKGFHLSKNASDEFSKTPYDLEGEDKGFLDNISYRKFTFTLFGGRDGWDIYRSVRTNTDQYIFGKKTYLQNTIDNGGVFSEASPNSDYYAYLMGYETFSNPESVDINLFATPGINFYDHGSLTTQVIDMIERDRADSLYILNTPNVSTAEEVVDMMDSSYLDSSYTATYWPWIQVRDNDNSTQIYLPPTSEVLRNLALTDNVSYSWFATAGYSRGLVKSIKASKKLTAGERDELYKGRINPIATFSDTGTIIWGNKTLQVRESALDRINVRRLLLRTRKLISNVAVRLLFEQNDSEVRNEFLRLTNPILESIKKERGLQEFKVSVSNEPEDIDANTLRGKIWIKPSRSLEFIDLEFVITPTGASFENI